MTRALSILLFCVFLREGASGVSLYVYDLESLAILADHIVLAKSIPETLYDESVEYVVEKAYFGSLAIGDRFDLLHHDSYSPLDDEGKEFDSTRILFLTNPVKEEERTSRPVFDTVPSGEKLLRDGQVYRLVQLSNPGWYSPVPQGRSPLDLDALVYARTPKAIEFAEFEADLAWAIRRGRDFRAALTEDDPKRLYEFLGPRRAPRLCRTGNELTLGQAVGEKLRERIEEGAELETVLEIVARSYNPRDPRNLFGAEPLKVGELARYRAGALDTSLAVELRAAALWILADQIGSGYEQKEMAKPTRVASQLNDLLADPEVEIRRLAAEVLESIAWHHAEDGTESHDSFAPLARLVERRLELEVNPRLRCRLLRAWYELTKLATSPRSLSDDFPRASIFLDVRPVSPGRLYSLSCEMYDNRREAWDGDGPRWRDWTLVITTPEGEITRRPWPTDENSQELTRSTLAKNLRHVREAVRIGIPIRLDLGYDYDPKSSLACFDPALKRGTYSIQVEVTFLGTALRSAPATLEVP